MFAGLGNTQTVEHSQDFTVVSLAAGASQSTDVTIPVERGETLNRLQIRLNGLESEWRPITSQFNFYNNSSVPSATERISVFPGMDGDNVVLFVYRSNLTGSARNMTAFTLDVKIRVMRPPF